ncbi:hypothetical protein WR25_07041 [Diploscapter pachys]|uniref:Fungal lipase-type domain-containing protein n=1 Tax=Diploscapter pachys TaxID=2018661 RepID=A0A2A2JRR3_9BILA|nr:hypothetical protein WR25_07041 [Diploscapter pachys]
MGNVNKYFLNAHLALWPGIEKMVSNKKRGASSISGSENCSARKSDQVKVVTFGQPRVGSLQFARKFDEIVPNCFRIVFRRDLVPHLPTCKMIEPERPGEGTSKPCDADDIHAFYHHGVEIWYPDSMDNGSKFIECTGLPHHEDFNCSDQIKFFIDQSDSYLWDHRHYFGKMISGFGKTGCNEAMPEGEDGFFQKALNSVYFFTDNLDLREDKDFLIFYDHELLVDTTDDNVTEAYRCTGDDVCEFGSSSQYLTVRFTTAPGSSEKFGFQGSISSQDRLIGKVKSFAKHNWALLILIGIVLIGVIFSAICCVIQRSTRKAEPMETREKLLQ